MENMVPCKKLWYYEKNYGTIPKTMELWIYDGKNKVDNKKLWNVDL